MEMTALRLLQETKYFKQTWFFAQFPLVLKRKTIRFEPELSERKLATIERLGFGLLNKVAMVFPHNFWGEDLDTFGSLRESSQRRGEFFLFYIYHTVSGAPVLVALIAGEAAELFEKTDPTSSLHHVMNILRGIYGPKGIDVPDPLQSICTRWGADPFSYGSYSHIRVKSSGDDYDTLAESLEERLFFGGEATTKQYPTTIHGAYLSGLREASRILQATRARQINPRKCIQKNVSLNNDVIFDLFKRPDLIFEKFSFVFDSLSEDPKSLGLMQVTLGKSPDEFMDDDFSWKESNSNQFLFNELLHLYAIISREQAHELQKVTGGSEDKLPFLFKNLGLKLLGDNALGVLGNSLISNIAISKRSRGRGRA